MKLVWKYLPVLALSAYLLVFFADPINLVVTDLGRHLTNGANVLSGHWRVLYTNFYSCTEPDFPFINHHWGTGVVFYLVETAVGFKGLHLFYMAMMLSAALLIVGSLEQEDRPIGLAIATLLVPIMAYRTEIRPEGFSYLIMALDLYLLQRIYRGNLDWKTGAVLLTVAQLLWVNLHIFWPIGIGLVGLFWLRSVLEKQSEVKQALLVSTILVAVVSVLNPFGIKGLLAPFNILEEYGYMVAENQSWFFMYERFGKPDLVYFLGVGILAVAATGYMAFKRTIKADLWAAVLALSAFGLGLMVVRGITLFAYLSIPVFVAAVRSFGKESDKITVSRIATVIALLFVFAGFFSRNSVISPIKYYQVEERGKAKYVANNQIGLADDIHGSTKFFKEAKLPGAVFNNYDVGSFLIHGLEGEKLFVDNRPEAYSVAHFEDVYQPCQEDDNVWRALVTQYGIETIFFYRHDNTPWGQDFLIRRVQDPEWVPIYVDMLTIILIRNAPENVQWIERFRLPDSMFTARPNG